jgi:hypothetical protein
MVMTKKDNIQDFVAAWAAYDEGNGGAAPYVAGQWVSRFREAGYYSVPAGLKGVQQEWQNMHSWCKEQFGSNHYTWTGSTFWFETEEHAVLFALRWV